MRELNHDVRYLGVDDLEIDKFESQYDVPEGISYNSYLILDEQVAVMDTCDGAKGEAWKDNLFEALGGRTPDYLVVHHLEPDHSALIGWMLNQWPTLTLVASAKAIQMLPQFFEEIDSKGRTRTVKEGDMLTLGQHSLQFISAAMIHWPEVMVSYDKYDGALYSADAFGKFGALSRCGFQGSDDNDWACEARRYYFNIVGKYGVPVQTLLGKVKDLPLKSIRPLHGPVLNANLNDYVELYDTWSRYEPETEGIFVAHASIHGNTAVAAKKIVEILREQGVEHIAISDLCRSDMAENVEDAFRYSKMIVAASSYDAGLFSPMYDFLHRLQIKGYSKRKVALVENGSWAPSAGRVMKEMLSEMKHVTIVDPMVTIRSSMKVNDVPLLTALVQSLLA